MRQYKHRAGGAGRPRGGRAAIMRGRMALQVYVPFGREIRNRGRYYSPNELFMKILL